MILLSHPDPSVSEAVLATLKAVWPEIPCTAEDTANGTTLSLQGPPKKLAALIEDIRSLYREQQSPAQLTFTAGKESRTLDIRMKEWQGGDETILLTEKEIGVLLYLWQKKIPATREDLLSDLWQYAADVDTHTIETHIYRLRQKIEPDPANPVFLITSKDGYQLAASDKA